MLDERRRQYLEAMGIEVWLRRDPQEREPAGDSAMPPGEVTEVPAEPQPRSVDAPSTPPPQPGAPGTGGDRPPPAREPVGDPTAPVGPHSNVETASAVPSPPASGRSVEEGSPPPGGLDAAVEPAPPAPESRRPAPASLDWPGLQEAVAGCECCPALVENRSRTVFGVGDQHARWMVIGEAPGADEDRQGEPFVGRAGQLLNGMLRAVGFGREQVYIANILKCRPPRNRDPAAEEAAACGAFLQRQIELIRPRIILVVGRIAAQSLLATDQPLGKLRGSVHRHPATGTPVVVTYHPAYLLRSPQDKRKAWDDLRLARRTGEPVAEG